MCENPEDNGWLLSLSLLSNSGICPFDAVPTAYTPAEDTAVSHLGSHNMSRSVSSGLVTPSVTDGIL